MQGKSFSSCCANMQTGWLNNIYVKLFHNASLADCKKPKTFNKPLQAGKVLQNVQLIYMKRKLLKACLHFNHKTAL